MPTGFPARNELAADLLNNDERLPPFGSTLSVAEWYRSGIEDIRRALASLLGEMTRWLRETLIQHDRVSLLGL